MKERGKERKRDENTRSSGNGDKSRMVQVLSGRSRLNGGKLFVGEMTTFFLWIWRAKRDSGRGLNFSLKFGFDLFFFFFLICYIWFIGFFLRLNTKNFLLDFSFLFFLFLGVWSWIQLGFQGVQNFIVGVSKQNFFTQILYM